jgi:Skp family chaperone for outer membrane proteins
MNKTCVSVLAALAAALWAPELPAQDKADPKQPFKLGVVNLRDCFDKDKYERIKEVDADLQKMADEYARRIQEIEKKMGLLKEQIDGLPRESALRAEKILQIRRAEVDLKFEREYGKARYLDHYSDRKIEVYNEIRRVVAMIAQEQKFDLILRVESPQLDEQDAETVTQRINSRMVLYAHDSMDITKLVIDRLNDEHKKHKAAGEKKP